MKQELPLAYNAQEHHSPFGDSLCRSHSGKNRSVGRCFHRDADLIFALVADVFAFHFFGGPTDAPASAVRLHNVISTKVVSLMYSPSLVLRRSLMARPRRGCGGGVRIWGSLHNARTNGNKDRSCDEPPSGVKQKPNILEIIRRWVTQVCVVAAVWLLAAAEVFRLRRYPTKLRNWYARKPRSTHQTQEVRLCWSNTLLQPHRMV